MNDVSAKRAAIVGTLIGLLYVVLRCGAAMAQATPPPPAVTVSPVVSRQVPDTGNGFIGRVTPIDKVDIVARVPGFIEQRLFTEGQIVKTGDLLFRIEQDTYKAAVAQQSANLAKAKAAEVNAALQLAARQGAGPEPEHPAGDGRSARRRRGGAQADILEAQAALEQAQINLRYTEIHSPDRRPHRSRELHQSAIWSGRPRARWRRS